MDEKEITELYDSKIKGIRREIAESWNEEYFSPGSGIWA